MLKINYEDSINEQLSKQIKKLIDSGMKVTDKSKLLKMLKLGNYQYLISIVNFANKNDLALTQNNVQHLKTINSNFASQIWQFIQELEGQLSSLIVNLGEFWNYALIQNEDELIVKNAQFCNEKKFNKNHKREVCKNQKEFAKKAVLNIEKKYNCKSWSEIASHMDFAQLIVWLRIVDPSQLSGVGKCLIGKDFNHATYSEYLNDANTLRNIIAHHKIFIVGHVQVKAEHYVEVKKLINSCDRLAANFMSKNSKTKLSESLYKYKESAIKHATEHNYGDVRAIEKNFDTIIKVLDLK